MSRDGSDWDYINEHMGGHDEDGLPNFMSEPGFADDSYEFKDPDYFETSKCDVDRKQKNIEKGLPARSHFLWYDAERKALIKHFHDGESFNSISVFFERSVLAVVYQLHMLGHISERKLDSVLLNAQKGKERYSIIKGKRKKKNMRKGLPARSYFPWNDKEKKLLILRFHEGESINSLSRFFERSDGAVYDQLNKLGYGTYISMGKNT